MKTLLLIAGIVFIASGTFAQKVTMSNDTLFYNNKTLAVGDTVNFGYGSGPAKEFVFVYIGNGLSGNTPLSAERYKMSAVVTKVYKQSGKYLFKAKAIDAGPMFGMKLFVEFDGAVDNKELIF